MLIPGKNKKPKNKNLIKNHKIQKNIQKTKNKGKFKNYRRDDKSNVVGFFLVLTSKKKNNIIA